MTKVPNVEILKAIERVRNIPITVGFFIILFFLPKNILAKFYNKRDIFNKNDISKMTFACMCNSMLDYCW